MPPRVPLLALSVYEYPTNTEDDRVILPREPGVHVFAHPLSHHRTPQQGRVNPDVLFSACSICVVFGVWYGTQVHSRKTAGGQAATWGTQGVRGLRRCPGGPVVTRVRGAWEVLGEREVLGVIGVLGVVAVQGK